jgi:hypothetical protein
MGSAQNFLSFLMSFVVFFISQPSLSACGGFYRSIFVSNSGKHMGSYQTPPRRNGLIPFSIPSIFFMSAPRFDTTRYLPTGRASAYKRGSSSGRSSTSCRSLRSWLSLSSSYLLECVFVPGVIGRPAGDSGEGLPRPARLSHPAC